MLSRGLAASPALDPGDRKKEAKKEQEPPVSENILQERMQHMIDMQNAYTNSFRDDDDLGATEQDNLLEGTGLPRGGSLHAVAATNANEMDHPDQSVGKGQIIFPNSYQQQPAITTLEQQLAHQQGQQQHLYYGAAEESLIEPPYFGAAAGDATPKRGCAACCCIWQPFVDWCASLWAAENLHRSFCYGAIDGMLTGAGLVATLGGFGFISTNGTAPVPSWLVAVTWVACTADALCMALGHVWSTHVMSSHAANERRDERVAFSVNRNESKAKLVDLLLSRGMLKIDAMSIADTLEGYPDIFVGALVGDAVVDSVGSPAPLDEGGGAPPNTINMRGFSEGYRSYGQFNELDHDPDAAAVAVAVSESRTEGVIMMVAFSLFGSLPSLLYYMTSCMFTVPIAATVDDTGMTSHGHHEQVISARSAAMTLTCIVMWCLGMWKSKFFDSNWVLFGIETVIVLMVCVLSAYALACGLREAVSIPDVFGQVEL